MTVEIAAAAPSDPLDELLGDVRTGIVRARTWIEQGELPAAHAVLAELDEHLHRATGHPHPSPTEGTRTTDGSGLTPAELRILSYLQTHLTLAQIGERLFVSRNTVSSQTASVYRKLGVGSRAGAIEEAIRRGLLPA